MDREDADEGLVCQMLEEAPKSRVLAERASALLESAADFESLSSLAWLSESNANYRTGGTPRLYQAHSLRRYRLPIELNLLAHPHHVVFELTVTAGI